MYALLQISQKQYHFTELAIANAISSYFPASSASKYISSPLLNNLAVYDDRKALRFRELTVIQLRISPALCKQFFVLALLDYVTVINNEDVVGIFDR